MTTCLTGLSQHPVTLFGVDLETSILIICIFSRIWQVLVFTSTIANLLWDQSIYKIIIINQQFHHYFIIYFRFIIASIVLTLEFGYYMLWTHSCLFVPILPSNHWKQWWIPMMAPPLNPWTMNLPLPLMMFCMTTKTCTKYDSDNDSTSMYQLWQRTFCQWTIHWQNFL